MYQLQDKFRAREKICSPVTVEMKVSSVGDKGRFTGGLDRLDFEIPESELARNSSLTRLHRLHTSHIYN